METRPRTACRPLALAAAVTLPTLVTWVYFFLLADHPQQKLAYFIGKCTQFSFPLIWVLFGLRQSAWQNFIPGTVERGSLRRELMFALAMGLSVSAAMFGLYRVMPADTVAALAAELKTRVEALSFATPLLFMLMGVFYSLVHSLMEEYYFRWFVFGQMRQLTGFPIASIVSALAFMAHHVIVLAMYFGWTPWTAFLSISISVGGWIWAWQYENSRTLLGPWIGHMLVDAGIFCVGYDVLQKVGAFSGT